MASGQAVTFDSVASILAGERTGQTVRLRGWVHRQRTAGKMAFVVLRDGTGTVQCTVKAGVADEASLDAAKTALIESSVRLLEGEVVADERAPGGFEVKVARFEVHQRSADFPLRGEQGTEFELDNRHLWLRSTQLSTVLRVKHRLLLAMREFFDREKFTEVDPSVITTNACEGGTTLFEFDYFGQTAYLSQSAQMYLEGCIFGLPKVYSITNSFRAEKSRTNKHLTEFHHLEAEYAWWDNKDSMKFQERLVTYLARDIATHCAAELTALGQDPARLARIGEYVEGESLADEEGQRFGRMTYHEAAKTLRDMGYEFPDGEDFGAPHETALTEGRVNPLFITDWPARIKAFYMHLNDDGETVACADLLGPDGFGELIGGSQRSEDEVWMAQRLIQQTAAEALEAMDEGLSEDDGWADPAVARPLLEEIAAGEDPATAIQDASKEAFRAAAGVYARAAGLAMPRVTPDESGLAVAFQIKQKPTMYADEAAMRSGLWATVTEAVLKPYQWYFDLRRYGSVPHSGFGLGIERLLRWFTRQEHIRDMLPYPRTPNRAYP